MTTETQDFGARLRQQRKAVGMTQVELAERAGTAQPEVSKWESGERTPTLDTIRRLASALGVSIAELIEGEAA